jgi:hypothetical protein
VSIILQVAGWIKYRKRLCHLAPHSQHPSR